MQLLSVQGLESSYVISLAVVEVVSDVKPWDVLDIYIQSIMYCVVK